jgi:hypothetical protein
LSYHYDQYDQRPHSGQRPQSISISITTIESHHHLTDYGDTNIPDTTLTQYSTLGKLN